MHYHFECIHFACKDIWMHNHFECIHFARKDIWMHTFTTQVYFSAEQFQCRTIWMKTILIGYCYFAWRPHSHNAKVWKEKRDSMKSKFPILSFLINTQAKIFFSMKFAKWEPSFRFVIIKLPKILEYCCDTWVVKNQNTGGFDNVQLGLQGGQVYSVT